MKKGITIVFISNVVSMLFSIITSFILPKFLSIESYGYLKVFQLYLNYVGILHLGFVDGIYLKYGGKKITELDNEIVVREANTIKQLQLMFTLIGLVIYIVTRNYIVLLISISLLPVNMIAFYKNLFQATGEFKNYGYIVSSIPMIITITDLILIFILRLDNFIYYASVVVIANFFLYLYLQKGVKKRFSLLFDRELFTVNVKNGITLTIGNFISVILTSIDSWFIQFFLPITQFSYFSFAVSVENFFNVAVSSVTTTMYNYLCRVHNVDKILRVKKYCTILGTYLIIIAFPIKFIVHTWLDKYEKSIASMFILISAHAFYFVVKAIYVNLYKARGQQKHYFHQMILILIVSICTNLFVYNFIMRTIEAFAFSTLITALTWYFICNHEFSTIKDLKVTLSLILCCSFYLILGICINNAIIGFMIYFCIASIINYIFHRDVLIEMLYELCKQIKIRI